MGFNLGNLFNTGVQDVQNFFGGGQQQQQPARTLPPQASQQQPARTFAPQPNSGGRIPVPINNVQQALTHPLYGPLVNNPALQQQMLQQSRPAPFNYGQAFQQSITHNPVTNLIGGIAKPLLQTGEAVSQGIGNAESALAGRPIQNQAQYSQGLGQPFNNLINQGYHGTTKQILGNAAQTALTAVAPGVDNLAAKGAASVLPKGLPSIVSKLAPQVVSNAGLGAGFNAAAAAGDGGTTKDVFKAAGTGALIGGVLPVAGAIAKPLAKAATVAAKDGATNQLAKVSDALHGNPKPFPQISDSQLSAVKRIDQSRSGFGDTIANVQPNDHAIYNQVQKQLGATSANDHVPINNLIGSRMTYETRKASQQPLFGTPLNEGGYVKNPFGNKAAVTENGNVTKGLNKEQSNFINEYSNMLKDMGQGNGVNITKADRSTGYGMDDFANKKVSNNYRDPSLGSGSITNAQWFEQARKELESGKGAYGASDEYKTISTAKQSKPQAAPPVPEVLQKKIGSLADNSTVSRGTASDTAAGSKVNKTSFTGLTGDVIVDTHPKAKEVQMSPDEYLKQAFDATDGRLGGNYDSWLSSNRHDTNIANQYAQAMNNGDKFPTPFIDNARGMQDGRNRAIAAKLNGQTSIPVKVVPDLTKSENIAFLKGELAKPQGNYMKFTLQKKLDALTNNTAESAVPKPIKLLPSEAAPVKPAAGVVGGGSLAKDTPINKERGFTTSVKNSSVFSPELKQAVDNTSKISNSVTDKQALTKAYDQADKTGIDVMHKQALKDATSNRVLTKQETVNAGVVLSHLSNQGRVDEALALHKLLAEKGTQGGQQSQAFNAVLKHDPNMKFYDGLGKLQDSGVKVTDGMKGDLGKLRDAITATKPGSIERIRAEGSLDKYVAEHQPTSAGDKLFSLWRSGLLTGARTLGKIGTSHTAHSVAEGGVNVVASGLDHLISPLTGIKSGSLTARGLGSGFGQGTKNAVHSLRTGVETDMHNNSTEFRQGANFGVAKDGSRTMLDKATGGVSSKLLNGYTNVGRLHGAQYQPFNEAFRQNEIQSLARAYAHNAGLKGDAAKKYVQDFIAHPESQAATYAKLRGDTATFQQETQLGKVASALQQKGGVLGKVIAPFTRIPSAIATDVFNYSPAGVVKSVLDGIKQAKSAEGWTVEGQRTLTQGLGRSIVGTAALAPGMYLYNRNMMTLSYPTDPKQQKLWEQTGKVPNSVLIGGKWRSLGSIGPVGAVLGIGGAIAEATKSGDDGLTALYKGMLHGAQAIGEQSYLAGTNAAVNALKDPGRYGSKLLNQYASSVVPTLVGNTAQATDKFTRRIDNPGAAIKNAIPGQRESLPVKVNAFGQPVQTPQQGNPLAVIDPLYSSNAKNANNPVTTELQRLQDAGQGAMPTTIKKVEDLGNAKVKLNPSQVASLQTLYGQKVQQAWADAMKTPAYTQADDIGKQKLLTSIASNAESQAKSEFSKANLNTLNSQVAKAGTSINTSKLSDKPYQPGLPKDPTKNTGLPKIPGSTHTTYDSKTNTFTQHNVNTGKTVSVAADGTRTVIDPGTAKASGSHVTTTYDKTSNTFTQTNTKTGRVTQIAADGTRTVTSNGSSGRRSGGGGRRGGSSASAGRIRLPKAPKLSNYNFKGPSLKSPRLGSGTGNAVKLSSYKLPSAPKLTRSRGVKV